MVWSFIQGGGTTLMARSTKWQKGRIRVPLRHPNKLGVRLLDACFDTNEKNILVYPHSVELATKEK